MADDFDTSPKAWLKRVFETQDDEITCTECAVLVSQFVDLDMETGKAVSRLPQLVHHLHQCPACWDTYQILRDVTRLEEQAELPSIEELIERLKRDE